nr:hypothetical protein [Tanacetum cinerariifolium]
MHTSKDDYLINTLRFISAKEATQIYGAILTESLTNPEMKETKAYKTYLVSSKKHTKKSKIVKRSAKKSTKAPVEVIVIRETPEKPLSKKKEKVDVSRGKGTELLSEVALTEEAQYNKQDSRSEGSDEENDSNDDNTQSDSEKRSDSEHETDENESDSESDQEENEEEIGDDEEEEEDEFVRTPSNTSDDETKIFDKAEGDEDEEIDYTTSQLYDDVDIRLNKPLTTDEGFNQKEGTDVELTNIHRRCLHFPHTYAKIVSLIDVHVYHEVPSKQTPTLLTVHVSVITESSQIYSIVISLSIPSFTPLPSQLTPTPPPLTEATNPPSTLREFASVFQFNNKVTTLEKEVTELKKDNPLKTKVTALVDEHLDIRLVATRVPEHKICYEGLIKSYELDKTLFSTYDKVYSLKRSQKDKDKDEDPSAGSDRGLKKRKTSKDTEPTKEEPEFEVADLDMTQDQEDNPGNDDEKPKGKALLEKLDWENPEGGDYPFDLTKPLPLVMNGNRQMVLVDYFFNNNLKYLQGGILTMTYTNYLTKTKAA